MSADDSLNGVAHTPDDRVSANAWKFASETQVVTIPKNAEGANASLRITGESLVPAAQHLIIVAEENSEATVILDHVGSAVLAQNIEFDVRANARLTVISLQAWEDDAVHASSQRGTGCPGR